MARASTIKLYPGVTFLYGYCVSGDLNTAQLASISSATECPDWDINTQFRIDFSADLVAGNASFGNEPPDRYSIYRQELGASTLELVASIDGDKAGFTDYTVKNGKTYRYYIYPSDSSKLGSPVVTEYKKYETYSWELLVVDDTTTDGVYTLSAMYKFEFNPEDMSMQNNTEVNKIRTFSQYLRIQKDGVNCWTGTLSALAGTYDCTNKAYSESLTLLDAIKLLSTDPRAKFLRDFDGHLYEIDVSSPIEFSQRVYPGVRATTKKLEWTEIGSSAGVQILAAEDLA